MNNPIIAMAPDYRRRARRSRKYSLALQLIELFGIALYLYALFMVYTYLLVPRGTFFAISAAPAEWSWATLFLALIPVLYLPYKFDTVCDYMLWGIYVFVVAPAIVLVEPVIGRVPYSLVFGLLLALALAAFVARLKPVSFPLVRLGGATYLGLLLVAWAVANGFLLMRYGVTLRLVSFADVYAVRDTFSETSTGFVIYLVNWVANVINVVLLIYCLRTKGKRYLLILVIVSQLAIYGLTGYKSVFAPLILVPLALWFSENRWRWIFHRVGWGLACVVVVAALVGYVYSSMLLALVDRVFLAPATLTALYYQHFSVHPLAGPVYAGFRELYGLSGPLQTPAEIIGSLPVFPIRTMANANLFADGYANFGWYGFVIIGLMLGLCLWLIKSVTRGLEFSVTLALFVVATMDMLNAGLPTILATHGLFLMIVFSYLLPRTISPGDRPRHELVPH